jgi:uncharacterized membrane protein
LNVTAIQTRSFQSFDDDLARDNGFHAVITPGQSLDRQAHRWLSTGIVGISGLFHAIYIALGLWIIAAVLFLTTAALLTLLFVFQGGLRRCEQIDIENGEVVVTRYRRDMLVSKTALPQGSIEIECERDPDYGLRRIRLLQRGRAVEIGRDLSPAERADFLEALRQALRLQGMPMRVRTLLSPTGA